MTALPGAVRELARRLGADAHPAPARVRLLQTGRMRQTSATPWMHFRAAQTIAVTACGFEWRARTGPAGLVHVRDALAGGHGALEVRALGLIPIARAARTAAVTRGELMRYLAELPLAPHAILSNPELRWRESGPDRLTVAAGAGDTAAEIELLLDADGRVAEAFAQFRPRAVTSGFELTPWRGRFSDYRLQDGVWLPWSAAVGWLSSGGEEIVWEGEMTAWALEA